MEAFEIGEAAAGEWRFVGHCLLPTALRAAHAPSIALSLTVLMTVR